MGRAGPMSAPLVSVCLPNLNTRPYLEERVETILAQTYQNWELVVSDNYSEDGAWTFFEDLARKDRRVAAAQAPREGMYANWNRCIQRARGELVYIATSDDTMAPDCLEKLVAALEAHPDCDVAHCRLRKIDEHGRQMADTWAHDSVFARSSGPLVDSLHVRRAPFDGLLHLLGGSVYVSITQLLIRSSLFERIGLFEPRWGSVGDFNWDMRAGLVANTVHVPDTWGGWRIHASQATGCVHFDSEEHARTIDNMIEHAIESSTDLLPPVLGPHVTARWAAEAKERRAFRDEVARGSRRSIGRRGSFILGRVLAGSGPAREYLTSRVMGRSSIDWARRCLEEVGLGSPLSAGAGIGRAASRENHGSTIRTTTKELTR